MLTIATFSTSQCGCVYNPPSGAVRSTAKPKHATCKTWVNESRHSKRAFRQAGFASVPEQLQIVAARTESVDIPLGDAVPDFELTEPLTGAPVSLQQAKGDKGTLLVFMCNHCPFVIHLRDALIQLAHHVQPFGIEVLAISSNSVVTHPQDGPKKMAEDARSYGYPFKYLYDESQEVAKAYKAACTPEFFLADSSLQLFYHGQFDESRPSSDTPVSGEDIRAAIDSLLKQQPLDRPMRPSLGCGIKWHPSQQPTPNSQQ